MNYASCMREKVGGRRGGEVLAAVRRVPPKAMPALLLQQDWALGLIGLKFAHHMVAGIPDGRHGLLGRPLRETFLQLVWPPLQATALLLAAPYLVTRGVLPLTGLPASALHVCSCCSFHVPLQGARLPSQGSGRDLLMSMQSCAHCRLPCQD